MANGRSQTGANTFLVLPAFLAWAFVAVGVVTQQPALRTSRPAAKAFSEQVVAGDETLPARLWQDPLQTAYQAHQEYLDASQDVRPPTSIDIVRDAVLRCVGRFRSSEAPTAGAPFDAEQFTKSISESAVDKPPVLVLPVFLPGRAYSEDAETRIRIRYAVVSGLGAAGYVPEDRSHIGYVTMSPAVGGQSAGTRKPELIIPFEWYRQGPSLQAPVADSCPAAAHTQTPGVARRCALVLWIDEAVLGEKPLAALAAILGTDGLNLAHGTGKDIARVKVIGPTNSDLLLCMLREGRDRLSREGLALPPELCYATIFSPRATISDNRLGQELKAAGRAANARELLSQMNIRRTIADDKRVCEALVAELALRGVASSSEEDHIALIAEWDTVYGRELPRTFARAYSGREPDGRLHHFTYLQGIDGRLPGDQLAEKTDAAKKIVAMERPEGKAQLDYVRRLEQHLKQLDQQLRRKPQSGKPRETRAQGRPAENERGWWAWIQQWFWRTGIQQWFERQLNPPRFKAIGVLGGDVYDKLLILRALRPDFPGVIFFTTDLHACLLHADEQEWTRNLVIASPFGLTLCDELQGATPPFRDSYQTSVLFATLQALGSATMSAKGPAPRVYEVARGGAHDLSTGVTVYPQCSREPPWLTPVRYRLILGASIGLVLMVLLLSASLHRFVERLWERKCLLVCLVLVMVGASWIARWVVVAIWTGHTDPGGEPFAFFEGISIWPTELLRLLAFYVSCGCLVSVRWQLQENKQKIEEQFPSLGSPGSVSPDRGLPAVVHCWQVLRKRLGHLRTLLRQPRAALRYSCAAVCRFCDVFFFAAAPPGDVSELWNAYVGPRTVGARLLRVAVLVAIYFGTFLCAFMLFGAPAVPGRGELSFVVDKVVLKLSVVALVMLLFLVLDLTRLCGWFVRELLDPETRAWPAEARAAWAAERGLLADDVDGWLSIRLIARHTKTVGRFIYGPFIVLFIMFVSRHQVFDCWDWPVALIVVISFAFLVAVYAAIVLRLSAKRARRHVLRRLRERLAAARVPGQAGPSGRAERLGLLVAEIEAERGGAFCPFSENPLVHALLIPFGGFGGLAALELLLKGL